MNEHNLHVTNEGDEIVMILDGKRVRMNTQLARQLARVLHAQAKAVDEHQNAQRLIMDQATMQRAGLPFGVSSNPKIVEAARQEAQWNSDLRRSIPLRGIQPRARIGLPGIHRS